MSAGQGHYEFVCGNSIIFVPNNMVKQLYMGHWDGGCVLEKPVYSPYDGCLNIVEFPCFSDCLYQISNCKHHTMVLSYLRNISYTAGSMV